MYNVDKTRFPAAAEAAAETAAALAARSRAGAMGERLTMLGERLAKFECAAVACPNRGACNLQVCTACP